MGRNKLDTRVFIERSEKRHGKGTYDYSMSEYTRINSKIIIICYIHGKFLQQPYHHWDGMGCPKCGKIKSIVTRTGTKEQFIKK
jgi:hypothetical protein